MNEEIEALRQRVLALIGNTPFYNLHISLYSHTKADNTIMWAFSIYLSITKPCANKDKYTLVSGCVYGITIDAELAFQDFEKNWYAYNTQKRVIFN